MASRGRWPVTVVVYKYSGVGPNPTKVWLESSSHVRVEESCDSWMKLEPMRPASSDVAKVPESKRCGPLF